MRTPARLQVRNTPTDPAALEFRFFKQPLGLLAPKFGIGQLFQKYHILLLLLYIQKKKKTRDREKKSDFSSHHQKTVMTKTKVRES